MSRAKSAKDAKVNFDKKMEWRLGLCELSVLGARKFLKAFCQTFCMEESTQTGCERISKARLATTPIGSA
jgi:hypothetical protein